MVTMTRHTASHRRLAGLGAPLLVLSLAGCTRPALAPGTPSQSIDLSRAQFVDLSHTFDEQTIFWPTADRFRMDTVSDGPTPAGYYYAANNFFTAEHGGTHLDAPRHFAEGQQSADQVPLDRLVSPAVVIDLAAAAEANADLQVAVTDLEAWEKTHGRIPDGSILLLRTGFSRRWPDAARYLGTAERGPDAVAKLHFPGLHPDAARWLVANRRVDAVGIDTASIDFGQSTLFETHRTLSAANIPAFENLTMLDRVPATGAYVVALPMKIGGGSGGPLRAMAIVPDGR
jgi:kynurenine formamidase